MLRCDWSNTTPVFALPPSRFARLAYNPLATNNTVVRDNCPINSDSKKERMSTKTMKLRKKQFVIVGARVTQRIQWRVFSIHKWRTMRVCWA